MEFKKFNDTERNVRELVRERQMMLRAGFTADPILNIYVCYLGAFVCNVKRDRINESLRCHAYLNELIDNGYHLLVGPSAPDQRGEDIIDEVGIYCSNYQEIFEKDNLKVKKIQKNVK